jgi:hypothetical protein
MLKTFLGEHNFEFTEKLVDQDDVARAEMADVSGGFMGVPFTSIKTDDGKMETIVGFDKGKLSEILGL